MKTPEKVAAFQDRLTEVLALPANWDSSGSRVIDPAVADQVTAFVRDQVPDAVPVPHVVPASDGGLQLEWHRQGWDVEIEFSPDGRREMLVVQSGLADGAIYDLGEVPAALDRVWPLIAEKEKQK